MTNAAVYLRISLDATGEGLAVDRQRADCRKLAQAKGWTVAGEYVDNSISASDARKARPGYDRLVRDFEAGRFDALICYDLDRLTRQPRQLEDWIDAAEQRGLKLVTANGEADLQTDGGRMYARIKAAVARAEVERKAARQRRANQQDAEAGKPHWRLRPFGYTTTGEVVPDEAEAVRDGYARLLAGQSEAAIQRAWTAAGFTTTRGNAWRGRAVRQVLQNTHYKGVRVYDGREIQGTWEPIVDANTWAAVQAILTAPERRWAGSREAVSLLSGLAVCECGNKLYTSANKGQPKRYRCASRGHRSRTTAEVDALVVRKTANVCTLPGLLEALHNDDSDAERAALLTKRAAAVTLLEELESDYDEGLIDGRRYAAASAKRQAALAEIEAQLQAAAPDDALAVIAAAPTAKMAEAAWRAEVWEGMALEAQRATVRALWVATLTREGAEVEPTPLCERLAASVGALGLVRPEG